MAEPVWFWQEIISPHMAGLASALAARSHEVTIIAQAEMSPHRAAQGWQVPDTGKVRIRLLSQPGAFLRAAEAAPAEAIHIIQGLHGVLPINIVRMILARRGLRQWAISEGVSRRGWRGFCHGLFYRCLVRAWRSHLEGMLAIGAETPEFFAQCGMPRERIYPFAYFLAGSRTTPPYRNPHAPFRFLFAGRLIDLKQVHLLVDALETLKQHRFELVIAGSGPAEDELKLKAGRLLPERVQWLGTRQIQEMRHWMMTADRLVLPSIHDGWGAVISEAMLAGTPVICSDGCGAAGVVQASGHGAVFPVGNRIALASQLQKALLQGKPTTCERMMLADWARCLGANAGADYLEAILAHAGSHAAGRPVAPWLAANVPSERR